MSAEVLDESAHYSYTRVYLLTSRVHHLLPPNQSPNNIAARSLCGISSWPTYWRGTGSYGETRQAEDMPLCRTCERKRNERAELTGQAS